MRPRTVPACVVVSATIVLFASLTPARQAPPAPRRDGPGHNAALRYWQAFAHLPPLDGPRQKLLADAANGTAAGADAAELAGGGRDALLYLRRGAAIGPCDWGLHPEDGPNLLLPHLARGRDLARLAAAQARLDFAAGDGRRAVDTAADAVVLGRHLGTDLTAIVSYLVQLAVERVSIEALASHLAGLDPAALEQLDRRLAALPPGGSMGACMRVERESFLEWAIGHLGRMTDNDPWKEKVLGPFGGGTDPERANIDRVVAAAGGTRRGVLAQFESLRNYYRELEEILPLPREQFAAKLAEVEKRARENPLASVTLPSVMKVYDRDAAGRTRMTLLKAAVAVARGGPERAREFRDASGAPLEYHATDAGFELRSTVADDGRPVTLTAGGKRRQPPPADAATPPAPPR